MKTLTNNKAAVTLTSKPEEVRMKKLNVTQRNNIKRAFQYLSRIAENKSNESNSAYGYVIESLKCLKPLALEVERQEHLIDVHFRALRDYRNEEVAMKSMNMSSLALYGMSEAEYREMAGETIYNEDGRSETNIGSSVDRIEHLLKAKSQRNQLRIAAGKLSAACKSLTGESVPKGTLHPLVAEIKADFTTETSNELKMLIAEQYVEDKKDILVNKKHTKYDNKDAFDWYGIKAPSKDEGAETVFVTIQRHSDFVGKNGRRVQGWFGIKKIYTSFNERQAKMYSGQEVVDAFRFEVAYEDIYSNGKFDFSVIEERMALWDVYCDDVMYRARISGKKMQDYLDIELSELEAAELGYNGIIEKLTDNEFEGYYGVPSVQKAEADLGDSIEYEGSKSSNDVVYGDGNNISSYAATASHSWEEKAKFELWERRQMDQCDYDLMREKYMNKYSHFAKEDWLNENFELRTFVEVIGLVKDAPLVRKSILQSEHKPSDIIKCAMYLRDLKLSEGLPKHAYALCKKLESLEFSRARRVAAEMLIKELNNPYTVDTAMASLRGNAETLGDVWKLVHTMNEGKETFDFKETYEITSEVEYEVEEGLIEIKQEVEVIESSWTTRISNINTYNRLKAIKNEYARLSA